MQELRLVLVFLAATFDEAVHVAAFLFFFDQEGIVLFGLVVAALFTEIHVLDAGGLVVVLVVLLDFLEADQFDVARILILGLLLLARLGDGAGAAPGKSPLEGRIA